MFLASSEMKNTKIYLYTKFEVSSFTHSKLRERIPKFKILAPDSHDPTLQVFCHPLDGTCQDLSVYQIWSY